MLTAMGGRSSASTNPQMLPWLRTTSTSSDPWGSMGIPEGSGIRHRQCRIRVDPPVLRRLRGHVLEDPESFSFEEAARDLFGRIKLVLEKTRAPRVSFRSLMGGLICRSLLQRVIPRRAGGRRRRHRTHPGTKYVARVFTYATPHGGIRFATSAGDCSSVSVTQRESTSNDPSVLEEASRKQAAGTCQ